MTLLYKYILLYKKKYIFRIFGSRIRIKGEIYIYLYILILFFVKTLN